MSNIPENPLPSPPLSLPAEPRKRLSLPATLLFETGSILLNEAPDADAHRILMQLLDGDYPKPFVIDNGKTRKLFFSLAYIQSEMQIEDPFALDLAYTRKMMAFLLFQPRPKHVLIVGLGGGSLTKFCHRQLLRSRITTLEIDENVIAFRDLFEVPPDDERLSVIHADAIDYFARTEERFDVVLLDGCDRHGVAPGFCNAGFYQDLRSRLKPEGMLVMNLIGTNDDCRAHADLIAEAFTDRVIVQDVSDDGNRVAFAFNDIDFDPDWPRIERQTKQLAKEHGLDFPIFAHKLQRSQRRQARGGRR